MFRFSSSSNTRAVPREFPRGCWAPAVRKRFSGRWAIDAARVDRRSTAKRNTSPDTGMRARPLVVNRAAGLLRNGLEHPPRPRVPDRHAFQVLPLSPLLELLPIGRPLLVDVVAMAQL